MGSKARKCGDDGKAMRGNCKGDKIEALMDRNEMQEVDADAKADVEQVAGNQESKGEKDGGEIMIKGPKAGCVKDAHQNSRIDICKNVTHEFIEYCQAANNVSKISLGEEQLVNVRRNVVSTYGGMCSQHRMSNYVPLIRSRAKPEEMSNYCSGTSSESQDDNEVAHFMKESVEPDDITAINEKYSDDYTFEQNVRSCNGSNEYYEPPGHLNAFGSQLYCNHLPDANLCGITKDNPGDDPVTSVYFQSTCDYSILVHLCLFYVMLLLFVIVLKLSHIEIWRLNFMSKFIHRQFVPVSLR